MQGTFVYSFRFIQFEQVVLTDELLFVNYLVDGFLDSLDALQSLADFSVAIVHPLDYINYFVIIIFLFLQTFFQELLIVPPFNFLYSERQEPLLLLSVHEFEFLYLRLHTFRT